MWRGKSLSSTAVSRDKGDGVKFGEVPPALERTMKHPARLRLFLG